MTHTTFAILAFVIIFAGAVVGIALGFAACRPTCKNRQKEKPNTLTPVSNPLEKIDKSHSFADMGGEADPDTLADQMHGQDAKYNRNRG